jgi:DNA-binding transcriptional LysR family regulator
MGVNAPSPSVRLATFRACATLDARGTPKSITDLHQHACIGMRWVDTILDWELIDGKKPITVKTSGTALVTDITEVLSLALAGVGFAYVHEALARRYIRVGSNSGRARRIVSILSTTRFPSAKVARLY